MPSSAESIKIIGVVLEYGMLLWLLYFLMRLTGYLLRDMQRQKKRLRTGTKSPARAKLVVLQAEDRDLVGHEYPLNKDLSFGRASDNDVLLRDNFVSHHHAIVALHHNQYMLEDLGSSNGTYLNDLPLTGRTYLKNKDIIRIGYLTMRFER